MYILNVHIHLMKIIHTQMRYMCNRQVNESITNKYKYNVINTQMSYWINM